MNTEKIIRKCRHCFGDRPIVQYGSVLFEIACDEWVAGSDECYYNHNSGWVSDRDYSKNSKILQIINDWNQENAL